MKHLKMFHDDQERLLTHLMEEHSKDESRNIGSGYADYLEDLHAALHRATHIDAAQYGPEGDES